MSSLVFIDQADDPRIAAYADIRERDLVGRQDRFVAEGEVVVRLMARRGRLRFESLLLEERRAAALADVVAALPSEVPVYVAPQAVLDATAGFAVHRGVLGIGLRGPRTNAADLLAGLPDRALVVVLVGIANHDNVGGIFRNAAAFGADAVLLDATSCDPLYRKAIRVSVGACLVTPFARGGNAGSLLDALEEHAFTPIALSPRGATCLSDLSRPARAALVLGAEGPGLPHAVLARTLAVRIPMAGDFDSLNVATTSGIALHALAERLS